MKRVESAVNSRRRALIALSSAPLVLSACGGGSDDDEPSGEIRNVTATTKVFDAYHQLAAVIVEYNEDVVAPDKTAYSVVDSITPSLRDDFMRWPVSSEHPVTAVYTNSQPATRADKSSVAGRYVVIELKPTSSSLPANSSGVNMLEHSASMATMRTTASTDLCDYWRTDWSKLVITQRAAVKRASGTVVVPEGTTVPTLKFENIADAEVKRFTQKVFLNAQGHSVHYSLYLPPNYSSSRSYPLFFYVTGNGGRLNYLQTDANGNFYNLGGALTRDRFGIAATQLPEDAIVVVPQLWRNAPASWSNNNATDAIALIENLLGRYSINRARVYAAGSSIGTFILSEVLATRSDLISAYLMFNGRFTGSSSAFATADSAILTNKDIAYINALPRVPKDTAWLAANAAVMSGIVAKRLPVRIYHGVNDQTISSTGGGVTTYEALVALYKAQGLGDTEIANLVKLTLIEDPAFLSMGVSERHASVPVSIKTYPELFTWALAIGK